MIKSIINMLMVLLCGICIAGCDSVQEKHKKTLEEQLVDNFSSSSSEIQNRVATIVVASEERNYTLAMNELGKLSASQINTSAQNHAIKLLMAQLRFNMEEEELSKKQAK